MADLQALIKRRGIIKGTVTNIKKFTDKLGADSSQAANAEQLETRIEKLNEAWKEFHDVEYQIMLLSNESSEAEEFEDRFYDIKAVLKRLLNARSPSIGFTATNSQEVKSMMENSYERSTYHTSELRLPRVLIEQFSGEYSKWQSFQDQFETSIHQKENLSNIHKFQYLKSLLKNEASSLIRHMALTDANYLLAWEKLKKRYNKKKYSVKELIELFLNQPTVTVDGYKQLRAMCDTSDEVVRGLQALGPEWQSRDPWLTHLLTKKLDLETQQAWAKHSNDIEVPTINCLLEFLTERCDALEACTSTKRASSSRPNPQAKVHTATTNFITCVMCNSSTHPTFKCFKFKRLNLSDKRQFIETNNLCQNCLSSSHAVNNCQSGNRCFKCGNNHHTLLHPNNSSIDNQSNTVRLAKPYQTTSNYSNTNDKSAINNPSINKHPISPINKSVDFNPSTSYQLQSTSGSSNTKPVSSKLQNSLIHHCSTSNTNSLGTTSTYNGNTVATLLSTVLFSIQDEFGLTHEARGLLDSGSQTTLISENCVRRVGLRRNRSYVTISGLASRKAGTTKGELTLNIRSKVNPEYSISVRAVILSNLTSKLPTNQLDNCNWPILNNLDLADPSYAIPGVIDVIFGNDIFYEILLPQKIKIADHFFAQSTIFGWALGGRLINYSIDSAVLHTMVASSDTEIQLLQRFWELEEVTVTTKPTSAEDECEEHYSRNTTRSDDGRYIVRLPFKMPPEDLGTTSYQANRRFHALERKFVNHPQIKQDYVKFMKEYEALGHMELSELKETIPYTVHQSYHLPHHCVLKETSSTTKLRVVFDGSCKSTTGHSLNDMLLIGPTIQDDLMMILLRFRTHKIAIAADIEKMYRQVIVHPADRDFQRILWRDSPDQEIHEFRLTTVTYGTSSAPFLACRTLHQLANDHQEFYPDAATRLKSDFYVDDMLTGCEDLKQAMAIYENMTSLLKNGGFTLRKWMTNDQDLFKRFQKSDQNSEFLEFEGSSLIKTLGLLWNPQTDSFTFRVTVEATNKISKRTLLSEASRIFDPLGWLSPSTILIKILFQQLWLRNLSWDDELPADIKDKWIKIRSSLHHFQDIQIPRFISTYKHKNVNIQLHGFSDASELAYGAAIYIRVKDSEDNIIVNLLAAKTKVSPIKQISLPRLELCAAVLLCRLMKYVQEAVKLEINSINAWTDSQIVLTWLSDIPRRWNCFIGNRTSYILEHIPRDKWMYVPSKQNPADPASRGVTPTSLITNRLWWKGPQFLAQDPKHWPNITISRDPANEFEDDKLEARRKFLQSYHVIINSEHPCQRLFTNYSSLTKIYRILCYTFRFISNSRGLFKEDVKLNNGILPPTVHELTLAENCCIKWVQAEALSDDLKHLTIYGELKRGSKLSSLTPFIDDHGIMRVGGRISNSSCNFDAKHPIILPQNHTYTKLIIGNYHNQNAHAGPTLLTSIIRQRFWIMGCRNMTRWHVKKCILCFMRSRRHNQQLMADLPRERVSNGRPFLYTGVDYAGPVYLRDRKGRGKCNVTKAYIALFICLSVKAIHIELVTDMTSEAFIAALKRFISRRGIPCQIHCDNGSNFIGARNELHLLYDLFKSDNHVKLMYEFLSPQKIIFKFNPPNAPHFGGLWESNVKSIKSHFYRISGSTSLTYEEATTLLIQIEALLNSRPLCAVSNDVTSYDVLTPAHFLIGEPFTSIPEPDLSHISSNRLSKWQNIQNRVQTFWRSWSRDYLSTLNQRQKWKTKTENLNVNQLVLIKEENIPQSHWIIGRIQQVHSGKDGQVRVATVKTGRGITKRPIVKLIPLPIEDDNKNKISAELSSNHSN